MEERILRKYAALAVRSGVNVQKGQPLVVKASVRDAAFVEMCVLEAYQAGASDVSVQWSDEILRHMDFEYQSLETLTDIPDWLEERVKREHDRGVCYLYIDSDTPGFMSDIDPEKLQKSQLARMSRMEPYAAYTMNNIGQWCIVALPNPRWACKVFPGKTEPEAMDALWKAILSSVRVREDNDPVLEWQKHDQELEEHCRILNGYAFQALHFENSRGTDLTVSLAEGHIWAGGGCTTPSGVFFNPNMPTEECFCMPDRCHVEGIVHATMPLAYQGKLIENFWLRFEGGQVVDFGAESGEDTLKGLLDTDEGARRLGEVALISYHSPISDLNLLFFNTLFDENASCHLALGRSYPENISGGLDMSREELLEHGGNYSLEHVDFMFGSSDMSVTGIQKDGTEVPVFRQGDFVF